MHNPLNHRKRKSAEKMQPLSRATLPSEQQFNLKKNPVPRIGTKQTKARET